MSADQKDGGADRDRTCDPHNAIVVLYQLSYDPILAARTYECPPCLSKQFLQNFFSGALATLIPAQEFSAPVR
jgi:hypothetical protein